jgi:hypothetical protein
MASITVTGDVAVATTMYTRTSITTAGDVVVAMAMYTTSSINMVSQSTSCMTKSINFTPGIAATGEAKT